MAVMLKLNKVIHIKVVMLNLIKLLNIKDGFDTELDQIAKA